MRKLKGHKEPKEVIKIELVDPVNWMKPDFRRDKDRKYPSIDRKSSSCCGCGDPLAKNTGKYVKQKNIPVHIGIRRATLKAAVG